MFQLFVKLNFLQNDPVPPVITEHTFIRSLDSRFLKNTRPEICFQGETSEETLQTHKTIFWDTEYKFNK